MRLSKLFLKFLTLVIVVFSITSFSAFVSLAGPNTSDEDGETVVESSNPNRIINNEDREIAYMHIVNYMNQLKTTYDLSDASKKKMEEVFYQMTVYVANNNITVQELNDLVSDTKSNIKASIGEVSAMAATENFIFMSNDVGISTGSFGSPCTVTIGLVNLGKEPLKDVIVTPVQDVDPKKWPFAINTASDAKIIPLLQPASSIEDGKNKKQLLSWTFNISDKALNGTYPIPFKVQYYLNGVLKEATINSFATINAKYGNDDLIEDSDTENISTPRIIVTGFKTEPETVYAGDTFTLSIYVQNTSPSTRVSNVQFDLKAASSGAQGSETVDAFLPTSGASSIYLDGISPKGDAVLTMEMTARNDLAQKPYVVTLSSKYEGKDAKSYEATADISIPVNQEAKIDFSDNEVSPAYISVGDSSNIIFDVYNKGKTTVYNVQVSFDDQYVSGGTKFVGKIEPGQSGNVDVDITGINPNIEVGNVKCFIEYEDQSGNVITVERNIDLSIDEAYAEMDEGVYDDYAYEMEEENTNNFPWLPVLVVIIIVIIIVVIVVSIIKNKKKKAQLLKELEDDDSSLL